MRSMKRRPCRAPPTDYALRHNNDRSREEGMLVRCRRFTVALPLLALGLAGAGYAVELNPAALVYQKPDQIKWNPPSAGGSQNAVMVGDPSKPGLYVVLNKWLKGNHFSRPHFHPNDRFITLLSATWWVATAPTCAP